MRVFAVIVIALITLGCGPAPTAKPARTPSGSHGFHIKCKQPREDCLAKAAESCGGAFHLVSESSHAGGTAADYLPGPITWFDMLVECSEAAP
jgi:Cu/Zn superoxide dismutase